jgi:hypothetical protein
MVVSAVAAGAPNEVAVFETCATACATAAARPAPSAALL